MIKQHHVNRKRFNLSGDFFEFAFTDECFCRRLHTAANYQLDALNIGRIDQFDEFRQIILIRLVREIDVDQKRSFTPAWPLKFEQRVLR